LGHACLTVSVGISWADDTLCSALECKKPARRTCVVCSDAQPLPLFPDPPRREPCDMTVSDFDDCKFRILVNPEALNVISVHLSCGVSGAKLKGELHGLEILEKVRGHAGLASHRCSSRHVSFDVPMRRVALTPPLSHS